MFHNNFVRKKGIQVMGKGPFDIIEEGIHFRKINIVFGKVVRPMLVTFKAYSLSVCSKAKGEGEGEVVREGGVNTGLVAA